MPAPPAFKPCVGRGKSEIVRTQRLNSRLIGRMALAECGFLLWPPERSGYHVIRYPGNYLPVAPVSIPMRRFRLLTVLLTLLTLPGYGLAGLAHVRSCQAQMKTSDRVAMAGLTGAGEIEHRAFA